MKSKRILTGISAMVMAIGFMAMSVMASADTYEDYEYEVLDFNKIEISSYTGSDSAPTIPSKIDGYAVTDIGNYAFDSCNSLISVTIPDSVVDIGSYAFYCCENLTTVEIPDSVENISDRAFLDCKSLTSITVDPYSEYYSSTDGVLYNRDPYSKEQTSLILCPGGKDSVTITDTVTSIEYKAFENCEKLTSLVIPDTVTTIADSAFDGCENVVVYCYADSYAEEFAINNNIEYVLIDDNALDLFSSDEETSSDIDSSSVGDESENESESSSDTVESASEVTEETETEESASKADESSVAEEDEDDDEGSAGLIVGAVAVLAVAVACSVAVFANKRKGK
ncbi:MAG: leucine-rich repeat domain-containing protein [Ruminococcus sp.]|nr:leucine-rich repeat domain-containing protein [Ruminococcus sp.]